MAECCYLTTSFPIDGSLGCIISVSASTSTETSKLGNCIIVGPTIGSLSIAGYVKDTYHTGCHGRASVQIPWIRKYDCDTDTVYFIFSGEGNSAVAGNVEGLAHLNNVVITNQISISASSTSGPTLYSRMSQDNGYGLTYTGDPISFNTATTGQLMFDGNKVGIPYSECYLQNFSVDFVPGQIPEATYSYVFAASNA